MVGAAFEPGKENLITDVPGIRVGNAEDQHLKSGVTVLTADQPFCAAVDVMGGAPGTRETDLLGADKLVDQVDALVLAGGSAFGLDAASGVANALHRAGRGYEVGSVRVPLVPAAIIFDLLNGGDKSWLNKEADALNPYADLGAAALTQALGLAPVTGPAAGSDTASGSAPTKSFKIGSYGAGCGATTATLKGGLGSASLVLPSGYTVGALVVANPIGSATVPGCKNFWAAPFEVAAEFGGCGFAEELDPLQMPPGKYAAAEASSGRSNTTLAIVATDMPLDKAALKRVAVAAQDGFARALFPSHTPFDGDLVFAVSNATEKEPTEASHQELLLAGHAASLCVTRAIARGVFEACAAPGDLHPCWRSVWS